MRTRPTFGTPRPPSSSRSADSSTAVYFASFRHGAPNSDETEAAESGRPAPIYRRYSFAVYELTDGAFTVTRDGHDWGDPFETTDVELARLVCDRWATEFSARTPSKPPTPPPAPRERPMLSPLGFVGISVGAQMAAVLAVTGSIGGTGNDPLWVGPTCAAFGFVAASAVAIGKLWAASRR
jgi:hypothetical protein